MKRRDLCKALGLWLPAVWMGHIPLVWGKAPEATDFETAWLNITGRLKPGQVPRSDALNLIAPALAEDGAVVALTLSSQLQDTQALHVLVAGNPYPRVASFRFNALMAPYATLRIRMQKSSEVTLLAETAHGWYQQSRKVDVVLGGCG